MGKKTDIVEEIEIDQLGACFDKFIRVRVSIDITKTLRRGIRTKIRGNKGYLTLSLLYERLLEFCYNYRQINCIFK